MAEFLYQGLVDWFQDQVEQNKLTAGDKMPSLRKLAKEQGMSLNTVIHGYELLSQQGWIESRPKSGYFVCHQSQVRPAIMLAADHPHYSKDKDIISPEEQISYQKALTCQASELLEQDVFSLNPHNLSIHHPQGETAVRQALSHYLEQLGVQTKLDQLWLANNPNQLLMQSLQSLTQVGDKVLILTPCDYRLRHTVQALGREAVCLNAGERGVDLDVVDKIIEQDEIKLLLFPSQFSFPAGQAISNLSLRRWYALIEKHDLPSIEWDLCSHLPNRPQAVMSLKSLDQTGLVAYIGGFEGLHDALPSIAWLQVGRYEKPLAQALSVAGLCPGEDLQLALIPLLNQSPVKAFAAMSRSIWANAEKMKSALERLNPGHLSAVINKGGHSLWVRSNSPISISQWQAYQASNLHGLIPGHLLSLAEDANHWFAVNLSLNQTQVSLNWLEKECFTSSEKSKEEVSTHKDETSTETTSSKKEREDSTDEPLYNPMLDLINHDFG
ncbi:GntR family transcriptional regulator [Marinomonas sp. PE14-40]|uniref:GntR family transcriptional regulator n=1 Tax=Marinomonas sp. PE14-40 TaxID=3060621 RepID=UPI003F675326